MQKQITEAGQLLNEKGELAQRGYATSLLLDYDRGAIKVPSWRIKEWDYYLITTESYGIALTLADNGYMGLASISLLDFKKPTYKTVSYMMTMPLGKIGLPSSSRIGDVSFEDHRIQLNFFNDGKQRRLVCKVKDFSKGNPFECDLLLKDGPKESMVIATPFKENPKAFYYNQKIVGMKAYGYAKYKNRLYKFKEEEARGILDWGRGVWTYKNTWYWGAATGKVGGKEVGWNIGCGFGDTQAATENMLFYDGKTHKLEEVKFNIPQGSDGKLNYMSPWEFTSSDGRFEMRFQPIIDRKDHTSVGVISSNQHQVFGTYSGTMTLDNGEQVKINNLRGFAEQVTNKW